LNLHHQPIASARHAEQAERENSADDEAACDPREVSKDDQESEDAKT
jgi:hypothetical protein